MGANFLIGLFLTRINPDGGATTEGILLKHVPGDAARMPD
jgi:hypothetical protein